MRFTDVNQLPYPATRREMANAPLASELLARRADKLITELDAKWALQLTDPTAVLTLNSNITGIPSNDFGWLINLTTIQKAVGGSFASQVPQPGGATAKPGVYHVVMATELQAEGGITANSYRRITVDLAKLNPVTGSVDFDNPYESYSAQELQSGGAVNLGLEFVTWLGGGESMYVKIRHNNAASTLRVNTTNTQWALTRIAEGL